MHSHTLTDIMNTVYAGAVVPCEDYEHKHLVCGNGHHMAQHIVVAVEDRLKRKRIVHKRHVLVAVTIAAVRECRGRILGPLGYRYLLGGMLVWDIVHRTSAELSERGVLH